MILRRWGRRFLAAGVLLAAMTSAMTVPYQRSDAAPVPRAASMPMNPAVQQATALPTPGATITVSPARIADSRFNQQIPGAVSVLGSVKVQVAGRGGIPASGVAAAVLNVTVLGGAGAGYVTVWPSGRPRPGTSSLNFEAGQTIANAAIVPVGADGAVELFNGSPGPVQLIVDVTGYLVAGVPGAAGATVSVTPARIVDSRINQQVTGAVPASASRKVQVNGRAGVPASGVTAAILNVTAVNPQGGGYSTVWASGAAKPDSSNLNFLAGQNIANTTIVPVGADGAIQFFNGSAGKVHVVIDVTGYVIDGAPMTAGATVLVPPNRMADSRFNQQVIGAVPGGATVSVVAVGPPNGGTPAPRSGVPRYEVPASGVSAVVLNVTAVDPQGVGHLTVWSEGTPQPATSNVNFRANQTVPNMVIVPVSRISFVPFGTSSMVQIRNGSLSPTDVIVDVLGYVMTDPPPSKTLVSLGEGPWRTDLSDFGSQRLPESISGFEGITSVGMTRAFAPTAYAVRSDGTVLAFGPGKNGELGNGLFQSSTVPVQVAGLSGIAAVTGGRETAYALRDDGTVWAWGSSEMGQLGNGLIGAGQRSATPVQVSGLTGVTALAASDSTAFAVRSDGTVWTWGDQFLLGTATSAATPVQIIGLTGIVAVSAGFSSVFALRSDGTVWGWGEGPNSELGSIGASSTTPTKLSGLAGVTAIAAAWSTAYALLKDGTVRAWGYGGWGALGDGNWLMTGTGELFNSAIPVTVSGLTNVKALTAGWQTAYAIRQDGTLWSWNYGMEGQLGRGLDMGASVPGQVPWVRNAASVAGSGYGAIVVIG